MENDGGESPICFHFFAHGAEKAEMGYLFLPLSVLERGEYGFQRLEHDLYIRALISGFDRTDRNL